MDQSPCFQGCRWGVLVKESDWKAPGKRVYAHARRPTSCRRVVVSSWLLWLLWLYVVAMALRRGSMVLWLCRHGYGSTSWLWLCRRDAMALWCYGSMATALCRGSMSRLYAATATALRLYVFASGCLPCFAGSASEPRVVHVPGEFHGFAWGHPAAGDHLIGDPFYPRISLFVAIYRLFVSFKEW